MLTNDDRKKLLSPVWQLNDRIILAAQFLLNKTEQFSSHGGFPDLGTTLGFLRESAEFVQI